MKEKRLPTTHFAELSRRIYDEFGLKCVLVGGPEEEGIRREIAEAAPDTVLSYASHNFAELAALIGFSRFFLGNDSGLMHMAVALDRPCVVFFGPTDERRAAPYDNAYRGGGIGRHLIVRREDLDCAPCWTIRTIGLNPACVHGDIRCMRKLPMDHAWPRIRDYLCALQPGR